MEIYKLEISLLSNINNPLLCHYIKEFSKQNIRINSVLLDSKKYSDKDLKIFYERTGGSFSNISLYDLAEYKIPFYFVKNHSDDLTVEIVKKKNIDLLINAGTPRILKSNILKSPNIGILNCHPGILPEYRGCTCVEWSIYNDDPVGNTVHFMVESIDEGPIVLKQSLNFKKFDTYSDIRTKVYKGSIELMVEAIKKIINENLSYNSFNNQTAGNYYHVIPDDKMKIVLDKINNGQYKYQF